uniref:Mitochondrial import inner membrane translocase subunit Tim21 n=1 Tax=Parascaris univalens TaxID=6257 RepID=A0A914ZUB5_PARUN
LVDDVVTLLTRSIERVLDVKDWHRRKWRWSTVHGNGGSCWSKPGNALRGHASSLTIECDQ